MKYRTVHKGLWEDSWGRADETSLNFIKANIANVGRVASLYYLAYTYKDKLALCSLDVWRHQCYSSILVRWSTACVQWDSGADSYNKTHAIIKKTSCSSGPVAPRHADRHCGHWPVQKHKIFNLPWLWRKRGNGDFKVAISHLRKSSGHSSVNITSLSTFTEKPCMFDRTRSLTVTNPLTNSGFDVA